MQIRIFTIPITDEGELQEEMNAFLRGHKVLEVGERLVERPNGAYWCYSVRYLDGTPSTGKTKGKFGKERIDYMKELDEATFRRFSKLREVRKALSLEEGVPPYAVFLDAELAELAGLEELTLANMKAVKGIGDKKVEKYGERLLAMLAMLPN